MRGAEIRRAVLAVWILLTAGSMAAVAAPLAVEPEVVYRFARHCQAKTGHARPCGLCGMTRAFVLISGGDLGAARAANPAALPLYLVFWSNAVILAGYLFWRGLCKH